MGTLHVKCIEWTIQTRTHGSKVARSQREALHASARAEQRVGANITRAQQDARTPPLTTVAILYMLIQLLSRK